jgi:hypothetical protein
MLELLLIELALGAGGFLVAACVIVMRRRRRRSTEQAWMPVTESQVSDVAEPVPGSDEPATEADEQQVAAGAPTCSERVVSYYAEADRPMAEYLAARGWTDNPLKHDPG